MSSNQRKNNNQRRNNYNNNNQQQNNKNQQQKRARYQPKYGQNTPSSSSTSRGYNNTPSSGSNRQFSPKQSPKRYNQRSGGPSSPNNRPNRGQNRHYNAQYQNTNTNNDDNTNNANSFNNPVNNGQRFKLKPTSNQRHDNQYNNNSYNRHNNTNNNTNNAQNQGGYNRSRRNNNNNNNNNPSFTDIPPNNELPPGFTAGNNEANYPPNRYRPNDTNNSERNRNWRNRYNPAQDTPSNATTSDISPSFRPRTISSNNRGYNMDNITRGHHGHSGSTHSHSRSPQSGPQHGASVAYNKNVDININISNTQSPGFQAHGTPIYKGSNSPLIGGQNAVGTPRSDNSTSQQPNQAIVSNDISGGNSSDCAGSELFGTLYGNNGTEPSIAYPVIALCLNHEDNSNCDVDIDEYKNERKYPVEWLLGVGKDINDPPNHPKDEIPESVKFINTIKIAGNKWKQNQSANSPSVVAASNNRFGSIHQLPQNQLTSPKISKMNEDNERSWRNTANKQAESKSSDNDDILPDILALKIDGSKEEEEEEEELVVIKDDILNADEICLIKSDSIDDLLSKEVQDSSSSSSDLSQYKVQHHTPELRADPREMVDSDELNVAPEWDRDCEGNDDINDDFKFGVIDKDREKAHFKNTGTLPPETATISREEYELREKSKLCDLERPRKPPLPHPDARHGFAFHSDHRSGKSLRSQSTPDHRSRYHEAVEALPIDKLPSRIRGIVIRLDEDIAKISSYIQQVALEKDQLNRYQRHLHKLIARRGQYANWWKTQQKKHLRLNNNNNNNNESVSVGLRHTNSLQQLEHYKDYYNKQLSKMVASASTDPKFNTYVDYYRQKLKAVEKRQRELESRSQSIKEGSPMKPASIIDVISTARKEDKQQQQALISNPTTTGDNDDPFASLNLQDFGYTTANTSTTAATSANISSNTSTNTAEEAMWDRYIYGGHAPPRHVSQPPQTQPQPQPSIKQRNISAQKQKLKQYIRQHALKYVKPPPDPHDETYPHWYQGLRKVENIIYAKYMNKQRKRMEQQQSKRIKEEYYPQRQRPQQQPINQSPPHNSYAHYPPHYPQQSPPNTNYHQQQQHHHHHQQQQQQQHTQSPYHHQQQQQHHSHHQSPQQSPIHHHSSRPHSHSPHSSNAHHHQHRMAHLNISPHSPPPSHTTHHTLSQHPMHPQSPYNMNMNMNMSPPMSPQNNNKYPPQNTQQSPYINQSPPNMNHPQPYNHPNMNHQYPQSPPNPNTTTTQHGYTTYNTSSPPNPTMQHPYQYPQN